MGIGMFYSKGKGKFYENRGRKKSKERAKLMANSKFRGQPHADAEMRASLS